MYDIFKMSTLDFNIRVIKEFMKMVKTKLGGDNKQKSKAKNTTQHSETGYLTNKQKSILVISAWRFG